MAASPPKYTRLARDLPSAAGFWTTFDLIVKTYGMKAPDVYLSPVKEVNCTKTGQYVVSKEYFNDTCRHWIRLHLILYYQTTGRFHEEKKDTQHNAVEALKKAYWALPIEQWLEMMCKQLMTIFTAGGPQHIPYIRDMLAVLDKIGYFTSYTCVKIPGETSCFIAVKVTPPSSEGSKGQPRIYYTYLRSPDPSAVIRNLQPYLPVIKDGINFEYHLGLNGSGIKDRGVKAKYREVTTQRRLAVKKAIKT